MQVPRLILSFSHFLLPDLEGSGVLNSNGEKLLPDPSDESIKQLAHYNYKKQ